MTRLDARDANHNRLSLVSTLLFLRVPALEDHLSAVPYLPPRDWHCLFFSSTVLYSTLSITRSIPSRMRKRLEKMTRMNQSIEAESIDANGYFNRELFRWTRCSA